MSQGSRLDGESSGPRRRRRSTLWIVLIAVVVLGAGIGAYVLIGHRSSDPWLSSYESADAGALNQDLIQLQQDLTLAPAKVVPALKFDCFGGRRDVTRVLSHPLPADERLKTLYHDTLQQIYKTYATCLTMVDPSSKATTSSVITRIRQSLGVVTSHALLVNAQSDHLHDGVIFSFSG